MDAVRTHEHLTSGMRRPRTCLCRKTLMADEFELLQPPDDAKSEGQSGESGVELSLEDRRSIRRLRFKEPDETRFRSDYLKISQRTFQWLLPFTVLLFASFALLDVISFRKHLSEILAIRAFGSTVFLLVAIISRQKVFARISQVALTISAIVAGMCINAIIAVSDRSDPGHNYYFAGLSLVFIGTYVALRLRVFSAYWVTVCLMIGYEYVAIEYQGLLSTTEGISVFLITNFILAGTSTLGLVTCYNLEVSARRDFLQRCMLEREHQKAENLLLNMLPESISARLRSSHETIADAFQNITVLFADIVNFTEIANQLSPRKLVQFLNRMFSLFDDLVEKNGLEKIKTIGDSYMAASGLPDHRADHAQAAARTAIEMMAVVSRFKIKKTNAGLQLRIGINSGPAVAGVIGKKRFIYDLWGDTVNLAARMESHGVPGEIQITSTTRDLLKDTFVTAERGFIEVKGKGPVEVFFLREGRE